MRFNIFLFFIPFFYMNQSVSQTNMTTIKNDKFVLLIHGGAGTLKKENFPKELEEKYQEVLNRALMIGQDTLKKGGLAIDVVELIVKVLEDSPLFNAGKGAVFNHDGYNEMDASIMDGRDLSCGAIAGVTNLKNPIEGARIVMDSTKHVFLFGSRGQKFCLEKGAEYADSSYFYTQYRWQQYQKALKKNKIELDHDSNKDQGSILEFLDDKKFGTVGCVVMDVYGNLASATSTGGLTNKKFGRIGDSPIIGAGTYADNNTCAISCTGRGEYFIRGTIARDVAALIEYKGCSLDRAGKKTIKKLSEMKGKGGFIAVDSKGNYIMLFNTRGMFRGVVTNKIEPEIRIYKE